MFRKFARPSVLMISGRWRPLASGTELQAERLACKLVELGFPMQVLTEHVEPSSPPDEIFRGVKIHRSDFALDYYLNRTSAQTLRYLIKKQHTFHILHNHQMCGPALIATLVARWLGKKNIIKLACAGIYGDLEAFSRFAYPDWALQVLQMADAFIAVSREIEAELLHYGFAPEKIHHIPNGVDLQEFRRTRPLPRSRKRRFILLGRRDPQKGIDTALQALKILAAKGLADRLELRLYGRDYADWGYRQMARDLEVDRYVSFLPFEDNIVEVYQKAYCLILPSVGEGLSNVLLEAMAMEMPVIGSRVSGTAEVVEHQKNGLLIPPGSPEALAEAMEWVVTNPRLATDLGRRARLTVQEHYSLEAVARQYAELYGSVVTKKSLFLSSPKIAWR